MEEYNVKLITSRLVSVQMSLPKDSKGFSSITLNMQTEIREPSNPTDSTVLLISEVTVTGEDEQDKVGKRIGTFAVECIFQFSSIPEDWPKAAVNNCGALLQQEVRKYFLQFLRFMGIEIISHDDLEGK